MLEHLDLTINAGEFVAVCGQTGCGKSTLLRLILGSERPTSGRVLIDGRELPRPDRHRGYVPQKYSLFPGQDCARQHHVRPRDGGVRPVRPPDAALLPAPRELRDEALRLSAPDGPAASPMPGKYPDQLSGGMQQRVAIAQALIMKPTILLMDEAFSALDPATRADMQRLVRTLWAKTGTTILFVTHNIAEAIYLGSRVVVLGREIRCREARVWWPISKCRKQRATNRGSYPGRSWIGLPD